MCKSSKPHRRASPCVSHRRMGSLLGTVRISEQNSLPMFSTWLRLKPSRTLFHEPKVPASRSIHGCTSVRGSAARLIRRDILPSEPAYRALRAKQILHDTSSSALLDIAATKLRTKKSFLNGFTKLHMFAVTLRCEHSCLYCQVSRQTEDRVRYDMSRETADKALDIMFSSPSPFLTLEFQGGEPFLAFSLMEYVVAGAKERAARFNKQIDLVVATNLSVATDDQLRWCRDEGVQVSTSLDGR